MKALFVGLGSIGQRHLRNLITLAPDTKIMAVRHLRTVPLLSDANQVVTGSSVNSCYGIEEFESIEIALLEKPDVIFITNPTNLHSDIAFRAMNGDAFIFIEKPVSHDLNEAKKLLTKELASKKTRISVGFQYRFHPALSCIKLALKEKRIGNLIAGRLINGEYMPYWHPYEDYRASYAARKDLGGGAILTQIHDFDYAQWLFGMPDKIFAVGGKLSSLDIDVEDSVQVLMRCYSNGRPLPVSVSLDYLQWPAQRTITILGESGRIDCDLIANTITLHSRINKQSETISFDNFSRNDMFLEQMKGFLDFAAGRAKPVVDLEEGIKSLEIASASAISIFSGEAVLTRV